MHPRPNPRSVTPGWATDAFERESVTQLFVREPPEPRQYVGVRSFSVDDQFAVPTIASRPSDQTLRVRLPAAVQRRDADRDAHTQPMRRAQRMSPTMLSLSFAGICVLVGISIGSVIAFSDHANGAEAGPRVATPAPAPAPLRTPIAETPIAAALPAPVAAPARITVRIESTPSGATVMLVNDGTTTVVGSTPIDAQLDPTRPYDLVMTLADHETHIEHLDVPMTRHVSAVLAAQPAEPAVVARPAVVVVAHDRAVRPRPAAPVAAAVVPVETGTLKISTKPPCQIMIDGKSTGLTTPQLALRLAPGRHQVTLSNADEGIHLTTEVAIDANRSTPLIQDFTN